ncbi:USP1 [Branchiostoma lanceolatum]|uniref:USP1 protein n=1 Tax=Branchiostoma lanceolatum TaxID=7740 RepID=A0A8K0F113_BRALA|nr:USP1 [Branchiostoma lanceolatum]
MVEESRMTISATAQDMDAPPRKRSKLSLSSRRKDDSSSVAVTSTQENMYPVFQLKGTENSHVERPLSVCQTAGLAQEQALVHVAVSQQSTHDVVQTLAITRPLSVFQAAGQAQALVPVGQQCTQDVVQTLSISDSSAALDIPTDTSYDVSTVMSSYNYGEFLPFVGLTNLHNTCYMNSVLQILMHTPQFALRLAYLQSHLRDIYVEAKAQMNRKLKLKFTEPEFGLLNELCRTFRKVGRMKLQYILAPETRNERLVIEPIRALDAIREVNGTFRGSLQHDAQELLRCVLSSLQDANAAILTRQAERKEELRIRQEKLAAIMAKKESKVCARPVKYTQEPPVHVENGCNGVVENGVSNGVLGKLASVEKSPKYPDPHLQNGLKSKADNLENGHSNGVVGKVPTVDNPKMAKKKRLGVGHARNQIKITRFASPSHTTSLMPVNGQNGHLEASGVVNGHANGDTHGDTSKDNPAIPAKEDLSNGARSKDMPVESTLAEQVSSVKLDEMKAGHEEDKMDTAPSVNSSIQNGHVQNEGENTSPMEEDSAESFQLSAKDLEVLQMEVSNIVEDLFEGQLQYQTTCLECETKSARTERFQDLSLPVKMHAEPDQLQETTGDTSPEKEDDKADAVSLSWSFETFMAAEKLDGENKYSCELCGVRSEAERKLYFAKLPKILTLHLKRFEYNLTGNMKKIHAPILTPSHLKLDSFCVDSCKNKMNRYELYGMILHEGSSQDSGHYVAYLKAPLDYPFLKEFCLNDDGESPSSPPDSPSANPDDVKVVDLETTNQQEREQQLLDGCAEYNHSLHWLRFNDSHVSKLTEEEVGEVFLPEKTNTLSPYLLFYKRTDVKYSHVDQKPKTDKYKNVKTDLSDSPGKEEEKEEDISR